ncbi:proton-conducting transporter membrane subunit [Paragemmobacter straminiformis]|uniref:Probable inorganic carbon transporter subunit DabB n=1 Tax=Paragemmobacter straminiformis TaxID=2045119 RepID=A0A842I8H0_9RHOB|nr:proton-conducting transporter membrane subunit [Gemmobacter straminiformis]MBC2835657.1 oxidoreductase [Gemmobacter straminiformis]
MPILLVYLAPLSLALAAAFAFAGPALRPRRSLLVAEITALFAIVVAIAAALLLATQGAGTSPLLGLSGVGLSVRLDAVSVTMLLLVAFIGWVVLRYSATYLDGEARQGAFTGWMALVLAAVMLLVTAGNLGQLVAAWVGVALGLHKLLLFYPDRIQARRAARKKAITARMGDAAVIAASVTLVAAFGTGDIATLNATAAGPWAMLAAALLAIAAMLKSALFPLNGWLVEMMETPTPVSALLHAGVVNAGGFLLIRMADVMLSAPGVLAVLVAVGGFSALVAGLVMLTQPAVKTALAWSTVAQMGFMILQCGLALFPLALLHIVAHSLYKAHAFLASGNAVAEVRANRRPGPVAIPSARAVFRAFALALAVYATVALAFGIDGKSPQALALGAMLIFGVAYLIAQGLADAAPRALMWRVLLASGLSAVSYFALQIGAEALTRGTLPATPAPGPLEWALILLALASFGAVALAQAMFPLWSQHPAARGLRVHLANGLYANALFDRLTGGFAR